MSSSRLEEGLKGTMLGGVVGGAVLPAVPDHEEPGASQDANRMGVVFAAGDGAAVEIVGPGGGAAGAAGEVADGVAAAFVRLPRGGDGAVLGGPARAWGR